MTSFYESATRGLNFDRFVAEELVDESTLVKMKQHFWTAKQLIRSKLGKKEDDHLLASDADFDTKLTRYYSIRDTSRGLLASIEDIHHFMNGLTENERELGLLLNRQTREEKEHVAKIIKIVGDTNIQAARSRMQTLRPIVRLYHELDNFNDRAILDCTSTIEAAEKARLEYRGSLMWMKKTSEELDPDTGAHMDSYRTAQTVVRQNKEKLDKLKEDTLQKVDLLEESRSIFLYEATLGYLDALNDYFKEASQIYENVLEQLQGIDSYEIDVLKILNDPVGLAKQSENKKKRARKSNTNEEDENVKEENGDASAIAYDLINFESAQPEQQSTSGDLLGDESAFLQEEVGPSTDAELISMDQPKTLIEERDEIRPDSPLGILDICSPVEAGPSSFNHLIGPLPPLPNLTNSTPVPKLQPPTGWVSKVKSTAQEMMKSSSSETANFMPSRLFDQDDLGMSSSNKNDDWSNLLGDFDPLKKQEGNESIFDQI